MGSLEARGIRIAGDQTDGAMNYRSVAYLREPQIEYSLFD
jgi:hypothetical protein